MTKEEMMLRDKIWLAARAIALAKTGRDPGYMTYDELRGGSFSRTVHVSSLSVQVELHLIDPRAVFDRRPNAAAMLHSLDFHWEVYGGHWVNRPGVPPSKQNELGHDELLELVGDRLPVANDMSYQGKIVVTAGDAFGIHVVLDGEEIPTLDREILPVPFKSAKGFVLARRAGEAHRKALSAIYAAAFHEMEALGVDQPTWLERHPLRIEDAFRDPATPVM